MRFQLPRARKASFHDKVKSNLKPVLKALAFVAAKKAVGFGARELQEALENAEGDNGDGRERKCPELDDIAPRNRPVKKR